VCSSDLQYFISLLKDRNFLDEDEWNHVILPSLQASPLSPSEAKELLSALLSLNQRNENSLLPSSIPLLALHDCLIHLPEILQAAAERKAEIKTQVLKGYFESETLVEDLRQLTLPERLPESIISRSTINPRLLIIYALYTKLPEDFSESLSQDLGDSFSSFLSFTQRRTGLIASNSASPSSFLEEGSSNVLDSVRIKAHLRNISEMVKRSNSSGFLSALNDFKQVHKDVISLKKKQLLDKKRAVKEMENRGFHREVSLGSLILPSQDAILQQMDHRLEVFEHLESLMEKCFESLRFFGSKDLLEGMKLVEKLKTIHDQMVALSDRSVALIFSGLIKAGKSVVVNTIIGEALSPSRLAPMTSIPVVYVHDPEIKEPVMKVPMAHKLNELLILVRDYIMKDGKERFLKSASTIELVNLCTKILEGQLSFKPQYTGVSEIVAISPDLHDTFRLLGQKSIPMYIFKQLIPPSSFETMVSVTLKFPDLEGVGKELKLSVIDTPGIDEMGMERFSLEKMIFSLSSLCHFVTFTVLPSLPGAGKGKRSLPPPP